MNETIFIFEFIAGGGFNKEEIPSSLFCEGFGMLKSIISDFKALNFNVRTLLDHRITFLSHFLQADKIINVNSDDHYLNFFKGLVRECKYCFIIAPEFSNILYNLTKIVKDNKKILLSIDLEGIELATSKILTHEFFKSNEIKTPRTFLIPFKKQVLDIEFIIKKFKNFNCPIIIKPDDGIGAESIYYFETEDQISAFFQEKNDQIDFKRRYILQEFIEGEDLSISLIGTKINENKQAENPIIIGINYQNIFIKDLKKGSEYLGGITPIPLVNYEVIIDELESDIKKIHLPKFNGYFGVDFIRKDDKTIYFIEINPRLTTSYIGIRKVINVNPAKLILESKLNNLKSKAIEFENYSVFSRWELDYKGKNTLKELNEDIIPKLIEEIPEFITPPISLGLSEKDKELKFSCFLATVTKDYNSSLKRLDIIGKTLKKFNFRLK